MRFFLDRGSDLFRPDQFGVTVLHVASALDYQEMVQFLLDRKGLHVNTLTHCSVFTSCYRMIPAALQMRFIGKMYKLAAVGNKQIKQETFQCHF